MNFSNDISLYCPYCKTKTQFKNCYRESGEACRADNLSHVAFVCTNCRGVIATNWYHISKVPKTLNSYFPEVDRYLPQVKFSIISNNKARKDFIEAIGCYNKGFYNASMVMARRAIHQEVEGKNAKGNNLYEKINSLGISENLKNLLNKVKNFGNSGAHPDFFLYDKEGNQLISEENEEEFAKLSVIFLDKYFQDQYEIEDLIGSAPLSRDEIEDSEDE